MAKETRKPAGEKVIKRKGPKSRLQPPSKAEASAPLMGLIHKFLQDSGYTKEARKLQQSAKVGKKNNQDITKAWGTAAKTFPSLNDIFGDWLKSHSTGLPTPAKKNVKSNNEKPPASQSSSDSSSSHSESDDDTAPNKTAIVEEEEVVAESSESSSDSDSSESESEDESPVKEEVVAELVKTGKRKAMSPSSSSSSSDSSSDSSASDSDSDAAEKPQPKKIKIELEAEKTIITDKNSSDTSTSDSSSDSSDSSSEAEAKPIVEAKVEKASFTSSSSSSDSSSDEGEEPAATKVEIDHNSNSDSSSSSSDSDSDSDGEQPNDAAKAKVEAKEVSSSDSSSSSSDSDSNSEDEAKPTAVPETGAIIERRASHHSESSHTISPDIKPGEEGSKKRKASSELPTESTNGTEKRSKNNNDRFRRVAQDTEVDPRFSSNKYVSYDYADRAFQDLSVTKGKGFTKEKNKKKRGSYRGGAIDTMGVKGIKFED